MRLEVGAAVAIGILLPLLETIRRGLHHWTVQFMTMAEDYLAGALLLLGAWAMLQRRKWAAPFLLAVWGGVTWMMSTSFFYQLEETLRGTVEEAPIVLIVKAMLWIICVAALVSSLRSCRREQSA